MSRVGYIFGYRGRLIGARSSRCAASLDVTVVETKVWWRPRNMNPRPPPYKDRLLSERSAARAGVLFATRSDRSWPIMCLATRLATASAWSEPSLSQLPTPRPFIFLLLLPDYPKAQRVGRNDSSVPKANAVAGTT